MTRLVETVVSMRALVAGAALALVFIAVCSAAFVLGLVL